jgi:glycerol dehydrogenase-like iron-containing ADH family enzyme
VAAPPTAASGDAASTPIVSVRLTSVPETDGKAGAELGDVLLPPQASMAAPRVKSDAA